MYTNPLSVNPLVPTHIYYPSIEHVTCAFIIIIVMQKDKGSAHGRPPLCYRYILPPISIYTNPCITCAIIIIFTVVQKDKGSAHGSNSSNRSKKGSTGSLVNLAASKHSSGNALAGMDVERKSFRILVVDDSAMTRKMLVKTLRVEVRTSFILIHYNSPSHLENDPLLTHPPPNLMTHPIDTPYHPSGPHSTDVPSHPLSTHPADTPY